MKNAILYLSIAILATSCSGTFVFDNPTDPGTGGYQGVPTVGRLADFDLAAPADGIAISDPLTAKLSFTFVKVIGATAYQLQAASDRDFASVVYTSAEFPTSVVEIPVVDELRGQRWYRARAQKDGIWSPWTTARSYALNAAVPAIGAIAAAEGGLVVTWQPYAGAAGYTLLYGSTDDLGAASQFGGVVTATSATMSGLEPGATYYVWLRATLGAASSGASSSASGTTLGAAGAPSVKVGSGRLDLSWAAVAGATAYELWCGTSSDLALASRFGGDVSATSASVTGLIDGTRYYLWVKAKNAQGAVIGTSTSGIPYTTGVVIDDQITPLAMTLTGPDSIGAGSSATFVAVVTNAADQLTWYLDGMEVQSGAATSWELDTAAYLMAVDTSHRVDLIVRRGDISISESKQFTFTGIPRAGLVGEWLFNGDARDSGGNGNDGVVAGAVLAPDRFGSPNRAYAFDGHSYITTMGEKNLDPDTFTISAWFYSQGYNGTHGFIISKGPDESQYFVQYGWDNAIYCYVNVNNGQFTPAQVVAPSAYAWHSLVCTFDRDQTTSMWYDGALVSRVARQPGSIGKNSSNVTFGSMPPAENINNWIGNLDDIRIYDRVLSDAEIGLLYHENGWAQ